MRSRPLITARIRDQKAKTLFLYLRKHILEADCVPCIYLSFGSQC